MKPQRHISILCRVGSSLLNGDMIKGDLLRTLSRHFFKGNDPLPQIFER